MNAYEPLPGVQGVMLATLEDSQDGAADPQDASFLRCVAQHGCPGHGGRRHADA